MDIATIIGIISAWLLIIVSIAISGGLGGFLNIPSILIVVGGSLSSLLISFSLSDFIQGLKSFIKAIRPNIPDIEEAVSYMVNIAQLARRDGILSLEDQLAEYYRYDPFLGSAIKTVVEGADTDTLEGVLNTMLEMEEKKWRLEILFWNQLATLSPAYGMIGTLIGLVQMLKNLNNPAALGPAMAVALITTFYGALIANALAGPIANKLSVYSEKDLLIKRIYIEGLLMILKGESPVIIEQKLNVLAGIDLEEQV